MKILINDYAGHAFVTKLSKKLSEAGYEIIHSYFQDDPGPKGIMKSELHKFVGLSNSRKYDKGNFLSRYFGDIEYGNNLKNLIIAESPDLIISSNTPLDAQKIIQKAAFKVNAKFIFWCQDFYSEGMREILKRKLGVLGIIISYLYRRLEKKLMRSSHHVIGISDDFNKLFNEFNLDKSKISIINNWGNIDEIKQYPKKNSWSIENNLDEKKIRILYSGTIGFKHNPDYIIELANHFEDIEFLVVGSGVGFEYLKKAEKPTNIILKPLQAFDVFSKVLSSSDICIALLEDEAGSFSVPSKVLSYLCAGKPVLMHGPKENLSSQILLDNECGLVSSSNNLETLKENLVMLLDTDFRKKLSINSREYACKNFCMDKVLSKFESIIEVL